jgi:hypothetical protein
MKKSTLRGFVAAAEILGYNIVNPERFHRQQREACFAWTKGES